MGSIVVVENLSLDGVMQSPSSPEEDPRGGFDLGGWAGEALTADSEAAMSAMSVAGAGTSAMLFGHRTYDQVVGYWLSTDQPNPFTALLRDTPKFVASRGRPELPHPNSTLLEGDVASAVGRLKEEQEGSVVILGSGELVRSLAAEGLVDEYLLTVVPVVLGRGTRLFGGTEQHLDMVDHRGFASGIAFTRWAVRR